MTIVKYLKYEIYYITMSKKEIKVYECKCERCGHEWITRSEEAPIVCPKCKSPYWDKPLNNKK
jgi:predicted Zn-ribbon and HTH transcriptional regulator